LALTLSLLNPRLWLSTFERRKPLSSQWLPRPR
jgi:hypothetical protein